MRELKLPGASGGLRAVPNIAPHTNPYKPARVGGGEAEGDIKGSEEICLEH